MSRQFCLFVLFAGAGWLCDVATFALLVEACGVPGFLANFASCYVGVTFVWFTSLKAVFGRTGGARFRFLFFYWGFQFLSILMYSDILHILSGVLGDIQDGLKQAQLHTISAALAAKIIVTPFNLVTNFMFMKILTRYMHEAEHTDV